MAIDDYMASQLEYLAQIAPAVTTRDIMASALMGMRSALIESGFDDIGDIHEWDDTRDAVCGAFDTDDIEAFLDGGHLTDGEPDAGYERYKFEWALDHGISCREMQSAAIDALYDGLSSEDSVKDALRDDWEGLMGDAVFSVEYDSGFSGEIWSTYDEWREFDA